LKQKIKSILFFFKLLFFKQKYDVIFSYSNHFNRGANGENIFLKPFLKVCEKYNIKYLLLEETDLKGMYNTYPRNEKAIYLDLITFLQILLRKFFSKKNKFYDIVDDEYYVREKKISKILQRIFFRNLKCNLFITLAHNNVILWREINKKALICDYQHGIISNNHKGIILNSKACKIKSKPKVITLVYGKGFRNILLKSDKTNYFNKKNIKTIGFYKKIDDYKIRQNNKIILLSLQNTDLSYLNLKKYYKLIQLIIEINKDFLIQHGYEVWFKNHPRYNNQYKLEFEKKLNFIKFVEDKISLDNLTENVHLHITFHSTTAFDVALKGIPTIFVDMFNLFSPKEIFFNQYNYPLKDFRVTNPNQLQKLLLKLENEEIYQTYSKQVYDWAREFYQDFNEETFLKLVKESKK